MAKRMSQGRMTALLNLGPDSDNTDGATSNDLGADASPYNNGYFADLNLNNGRGNYTMIEEEEYLTLRNNKTGKLYRLVMEEIEPPEGDE
mgnify:FL=1